MPDLPEGNSAATPEPANIPANTFESIVDEVKSDIAKVDAPADETPVETPTNEEAPKDDESTSGDDAGETSESETKEEASDEKEGESTEGESKPDEAPADDQPQEPTVAEQLLKLMRDPELLNSALEAAGVETLEELPIWKQIVGRERQSVADSTRAEILREAREQALVNESLARGDKLADEFVEAIEKAAKAIEGYDPDNSEEPLAVDIPTSEVIKEAFEEYAKSRVGSYHAQMFLPISDRLYQLPEMSGVDPEQAVWQDSQGVEHTLAEANGQAPAVWLDAHLQVARNNLWVMAQNAVAEKAQEVLDNERKVITAAHQEEIAKLEKKYEKITADAVKKTKDDTRAEVMAEFASKGAPPRVPDKDRTPELDDGDIDGDDFDSIAQSVARSLKSSSGGV